MCVLLGFGKFVLFVFIEHLKGRRNKEVEITLGWFFLIEQGQVLNHAAHFLKGNS